MRYYLAVAAALAMQVSAARSETVVALIGSDLLANIDTRSAKATDLTKIEGIGPVLGIDVRPADGQLYALASDGTVATIDTATGKATPKSKLDLMPPEGAKVTVDFNPVADRMRIIGSDGTNLRANVDDGKVTEDKPLKFADTDAASGQTPTIVAGAYGNSVKGAKETTLYDIDAALGGLFRQAPPNDGILNTIGMLGLDAETVAFDIATDAAGTNTGMLLAKGNLYTVDLTTGKALAGKAIGKLPSDIRDIAIIPGIAAKQAAADPMKSDGMQMKANAETTSAYLPKAMPDMKTGNPQKAGYDMKMGSEKKVQYRADSGMQSAPKAKRGVQCDRNGKPIY